jgi:hypothetical protein
VASYLETSTTTDVACSGSLGSLIADEVTIAGGPTTWAVVRPRAEGRGRPRGT